MSDENTAKDKENSEIFYNADNTKLNLESHEEKTVIHPTEGPMDHDDATFVFFHGLAEKMILKRNDAGDICTLSSWLKALERTKNKTIRNDYIKLMTMALQYPEPICPFRDHPPEPIDPMENGLFEMARKLMNREGTATCVGQNETRFQRVNPSISTAVSRDRCHYASCQVVPNVGVQCYFAYSDDPIYYWSMPPQITIPVHGPHATDLDWERAAAGVHVEAVSESMEHLMTKKVRDNKNGRAENEKLSFATSSKFFKKKLQENEESDLCNVMNVEQQNRNVTEEFGWNEGSLLTGEIILGAEECSDRKIDAHVNTQSAIDEDAAGVHERLYPGDFRMYVHPSVIADVFPMKKVAVLDAENGDDETRGKADDCTKNRDDHKGRCCGSTNTKNNNNNNNNNNNRQSAGQEYNVGLPERPLGDCTVSKPNQKHRISELSAELVTMKTTTGLNKCDGRQRDEPTRCNSKPSKDAKSLFETASVEYQRVVNVAKESFDDIHSSFQNKRNIPKKIGKKPGNLKDSNEPSVT